MIRLLIHSPDCELIDLMASVLRSECIVISEPDIRKLKQTADSRKADVVVLDFDSRRDSLEHYLEHCDHASDSPVPVVVMTGLDRPEVREFYRHGAFDCIPRPPSPVELRISVRRAYERAIAKRELETSREMLYADTGCDKLVGSSGPSQAVYSLIRRVASLNAFVLITGESGTGKELVANAIHNLGKRSKRPFLAISCSALPETLIESELFGHERGAFTGANTARAGWLEQAGDGTILLDEIAELSLHAQVKLLRVLQQRQFARLGGSKLIDLKARVLFATHQRLAQMVDAGKFRRDLYFRLNVMNIHVPALRERKEDIEPLARHFMKKYAAEYEKRVVDIRPGAIDLLTEYDWPGNVRELENVMQKAVILADDAVITRSGVRPHIMSRVEADTPAQIGGQPICFEDELRRYKIKLVTKTIDECRGNKSLAARKLKVSRAYLHRLVRVESEAMSSDAA